MVGCAAHGPHLSEVPRSRAVGPAARHPQPAAAMTSQAARSARTRRTAALNPARPPPPSPAAFTRRPSSGGQPRAQRHGRDTEASVSSAVYALPFLLPDRHTYGTGVERWHGRELTSDNHWRTAVRENDRARGLRRRRIAVHDPGRTHVGRQRCRLSRGPRCHVSRVRLRMRRMRSWYDIACLLLRCRQDDRFRPACSGYGN